MTESQVRQAVWLVLGTIMLPLAVILGLWFWLLGWDTAGNIWRDYWRTP